MDRLPTTVLESYHSAVVDLAVRVSPVKPPNFSKTLARATTPPPLDVEAEACLDTHLLLAEDDDDDEPVQLLKRRTSGRPQKKTAKAIQGDGSTASMTEEERDTKR